MKIIAGQVEVYGTKDEVAILTARTSIKPKKYVLSSRVAHFVSMLCQNVSDLQISNSFEKLRLFCIKVIFTIFF